MARNTAGGVGGLEEERDELAVLDSTLSALELPGREAAEVDMKPLNSRRSTVVGELNLELYLIQLDRCATYGAGVIDPRSGPVRPTCGRGVGTVSFPVRIASRAF